MLRAILFTEVIQTATFLFQYFKIAYCYVGVHVYTKLRAMASKDEVQLTYLHACKIGSLNYTMYSCVFPQRYDPTVNYDSDPEVVLNNARVSLHSLSLSLPLSNIPFCIIPSFSISNSLFSVQIHNICTIAILRAVAHLPPSILRNVAVHHKPLIHIDH